MLACSLTNLQGLDDLHSVMGNSEIQVDSQSICIYIHFDES